jgi:hypothetical protein
VRGRECIRLPDLEKALRALFTTLDIMKRASECCLIEERLRNHAWERVAKCEPMVRFPEATQLVEVRVALANNTIQWHEQKSANGSREHAERIARQCICRTRAHILLPAP